MKHNRMHPIASLVRVDAESVRRGPQTGFYQATI